MPYPQEQHQRLLEQDEFWRQERQNYRQNIKMQREREEPSKPFPHQRECMPTKAIQAPDMHHDS